MPLRIVVIVSVAMAAPVAVPLAANALPASGVAEVASQPDDPGTGDPVPILEPTAPSPRAMQRGDGLVGITNMRSPAPYHAAAAPGYRPSLSGVALAIAIVIGFVPALLMMARSSRRRRAGPHHGSSGALSDTGGPTLGTA